VRKRKLIIVSVTALCLLTLGIYFWQTKRLPLRVRLALETGTHFKLLSIDPLDGPIFGKLPHAPSIAGYHVLGETLISSPTERRTIIRTLTESIANFNGEYALCFLPRHAVSFDDGANHYDILFCFECSPYYVYRNGKLIDDGGLTGDPEPLNAILRAANVPLPKRDY
jgi:hypothetical protein